MAPLGNMAGGAAILDDAPVQARPLRAACAPADLDAGLVAALVSGGDSRLAIDPASGLNKYLCPPRPAPAIACLSSCTASPISAAGWAAARDCYGDVLQAATPAARRARIEQRQAELGQALLAYFGAERIAAPLLLPSGTDAVLVTAALLALEGGAQPITAILPVAAETGSGVPRAAAMRGFDPGPVFDLPVLDATVATLEIPVRRLDGTPREAGELADAYAGAVAAARGRAIVYLTHGSKTGLVVPDGVPAGAEVVVDACQARVSPATVRRYLLRGWPVIVTGSKFFGGPAFAGAVLFPTNRLGACLRGRWRSVVPAGFVAADDAHADLPDFGPLLRWTAALPTVRAIAAIAPLVPAVLDRLTAQAEQALSALASIRLVPGGSPAAADAATWPSGIVTLAVRDRADDRRLLTAEELQRLYRALARRGVLLGQPVALGAFGGLRVAVGARDVLAGDLSGALARLQSALDELAGRGPGPR